MKKLLITMLFVAGYTATYSQEYISTNRTPVGLEYNLLFNADELYTVTQTGTAKLSVPALFNGAFNPSYTSTAPSVSSPTEILIEGLPKHHVQQGAYIGWSTRWWNAKKFKIEGFDEYYGNGWTTIADYSTTDYSGYSFYVKAPYGAFTKLRFTFYEATGTDGRLGVSELFFIHPEATSPYKNLFKGTSAWDKSGNNTYLSNGRVGIGTTTPVSDLEIGNSSGAVLSISTNGANGNISNPKKMTLDFLGYNDGNKARISAFEQTYNTHGSKLSFFVNDGTSSTSLKEYLTIVQNGNVGIGTTNPTEKLTVKGTIRATKVEIRSDGEIPASDYVFEPDYKLRSLEEVETFVKENRHLPEVPSAAEFKENGYSIGEMDDILLRKVEELTLYAIEQQKELEEKDNEIDSLKQDLIKKENLLLDLLKRIETIENKITN